MPDFAVDADKLAIPFFAPFVRVATDGTNTFNDQAEESAQQPEPRSDIDRAVQKAVSEGRKMISTGGEILINCTDPDAHQKVDVDAFMKKLEESNEAAATNAFGNDGARH